MLTPKQVDAMFKNAPPGRWKAVVQTVLIDQAASIEKLQAAFDQARADVIEPLLKGSFALAEEVKQLREEVAGQGAAPDAPDPAVAGGEASEGGADLDATLRAAAEAEAAAGGVAPPAATAPPAPPAQNGTSRPRSGPVRSAPSASPAPKGGRRQAPPARAAQPMPPIMTAPIATRIGADGVPLSVEEEMIERQMDEAIAAMPPKQA